MSYLIGFIIGILFSMLIFLILAFFRSGIEKRIKIVETKMGNVGPRTKGQIFVPEDEADVTRKKYIKKEHDAGRDVPVSDLQ